MKVMPSFHATIWIGLREAYTFRVHPIEELERLVQEHVNVIPGCFTITPTRFVYRDGEEPGATVGLINYHPRFPSTPELLLSRAAALARVLGKELGQLRVTVTGSDKTIMLEKGEDY